MNTDSLYEVLCNIPKRKSEHFNKRVDETRKAIRKELRPLWKDCIQSFKLELPLLVLDEAHHLKNPKTQLASLFHTAEAQEDADEISRGPLGGVFERMLFMTATPFQLGHGECARSWTGSRESPGPAKKLRRMD